MGFNDVTRLIYEVYDSDVEYKYVKKSEEREEVKVYVKLPS